MLTINRTPDKKPVIHLGELSRYRRAFRLAYRPGVCVRTLAASIVATGSLQGLDLSQEADFELRQLQAPGRMTVLGLTDSRLA
jgi:hypothetical protein